MKTFALAAATAVTLGLAAMLGTAAPANATVVAAKIPARVAHANVVPAHWYRYHHRHCWWRHGYRHCHWW
jgi:hypothetical protein